MTLSGISGGSNSNNKIYTESKKSDEETKKRYEYIQKYSVSETVLAEAIIIGQKAFFAVADFTDPNEVKITLEKQIELDDDRKTVLKPLDLISYITSRTGLGQRKSFGVMSRRQNKKLQTRYIRRLRLIGKNS